VNLEPNSQYSGGHEHTISLHVIGKVLGVGSLEFLAHLRSIRLGLVGRVLGRRLLRFRFRRRRLALALGMLLVSWAFVVVVWVQERLAIR